MEWQLLSVSVPARLPSATAITSLFSAEPVKKKARATSSKSKSVKIAHGRSRTKKRKLRKDDDGDDNDTNLSGSGSEDEEEEDADGGTADDDGDDELDDDRPRPAATKDAAAAALSSALRRDLVAESKAVNDLLGAASRAARQSSDLTQGSRSNVQWTEPWARSLDFDFDGKRHERTSLLHRSIPYLAYHTVEWPTVLSNSEARLRRETVAAAIHEFCVVFAYRPAVLSDADGGAAAVRATLERVVARVLIEGKGVRAPKGDKVRRLLAWPDDVQYDSLRASVVNDRFDFERRRDKRDRRVKIAAQQKSVNVVVNAIKNCDVVLDARKFGSGSTKKKGGKVFVPQVKRLVEEVVWVRHTFFFLASSRVRLSRRPAVPVSRQVRLLAAQPPRTPGRRLW